MKIYYKNKSLDISVREVSLFGQIFGLMFRSSSTRSLLFNFPRKVYLSIHAWFVFFKFIAIWLDDKNRVVDWKVVNPFSISILPSEMFRKLVEIPLTTANMNILRFLDGEQRFK